MASLFDPLQVGALRLPNRIVMAPLTRNRAPGAVPTPLMAEYYRQRASAGLLITEATAISHQGQGYADVPGLYGTEQLDGWKKVTDAVHAAGGKHRHAAVARGPRVAHLDLQPGRGTGSAIGHRRQDQDLPHQGRRGQLRGNVRAARAGRRRAARHRAGLPPCAARMPSAPPALTAWKCTRANGYLMDQFLKTGSNHRATITAAASKTAPGCCWK
jgi:N-ethylmaleimide reductase